jgi:glycine/D-amino acid oxidase-like deaminating enzyme
MAIDGEPAPLQLYRHGYLILALDEGEASDMRANFALQEAEGCNVALHDRDGVKALRPSMFTDDVQLAVYSPDDMTVDPGGALNGVRAKCRALGATFVAAEVCGLDVEAQRVCRVVLDDGQRLETDWVVNTAGAWAPAICRLLDLEIPVRPAPKTVYFFECREPLVGEYGVSTDSRGGGFRPSGSGYLCLANRPEIDGEFCWEPDLERWENEKWPQLAHRIPVFEAIKLRSAYACHYAQNTFDGNLLLGPWPGKPANFLIATGASGHGFQHAPAAGRALSELIIDGRYRTLDLDRFGCARVPENRPDPERGFKA